MTSDEQFEKWWQRYMKGTPTDEIEDGWERHAWSGWHARDDELASLRAQIADLELQHVGDKAIIEALNERVRELTQQLATINQMIGQPAPDVQTVTISDPAQLNRLTQLKRPPMTRELPSLSKGGKVK